MLIEPRVSIWPSANRRQKIVDKAIERVPERGIHTEESRRSRAQFLENKTGVELSGLFPHQLVPSHLKNNIESFIGVVEVPVGVAGPLHLKGTDFDEMVYAPIATSEGALVASISRGAYAINLAGGVRARFIKQRMSRAPVFNFKSMQDAYQFSTWCDDKLDQLRKVVRKYSSYAELVSVTPQIFGKSASLKFSFETGDAAGQNMTTTCTWHACQWLQEQWAQDVDIPLESFIVEGNGSCDKKVSFVNFREGRGCEAVAECHISGAIIKRVLKVTPEELFDSFQRAVSQSCTSGMIGYNINVSNLIAGIFTSTGQDIACVHESSLAHFNIELIENDIYASIQLPSLVIGTVGGGTNLPGQRQLLKLIDCDGAGKVKRFAEIIAGFALALELSTSSAVAGGQFALAHEKYGRNRPVEWIKQNELEEKILPDFLADHLGRAVPEDLVIDCNSEFPIGDSIVSELCNINLKKFVGVYPYDLRFSSDGEQHILKTIVKLKALDTEMHLIGTTMAAMGSRELAELFKEHGMKTGFANCHKKELAICSQTFSEFADHVPKTYHTAVDDERELYLMISERLEDTHLKDSADNIQGWGSHHIKEVIRSAASCHSVWFCKDLSSLTKNYYVTQRLSSADYLEMTPLFSALLENARNEFPEIVTEEYHNSIQNIIRKVNSWAPQYCALPATLIHNDFNPRNIIFRNTESGPKAMFYDWELACINLPQRDLAEFLCFVLKGDVEMNTLEDLVELHRTTLESHIGTQIDHAEWSIGFKYALYDFIIGRLMMYLMAHALKDYKFIDRVFRSSMSLLRKVE